MRELTRIAPRSIKDNFNIKYVDDEDSLAGARQADLLVCYSRLVRQGELGEGHRCGTSISVDENVLENFRREGRKWVVPVWEAEWRVGELGELGEQGYRGVWLYRSSRYLRCGAVPKVVIGDKRPLEGLRMMAVDR